VIAYLRAMWVVFRKEVRTGVRDRRALFSALLYPLIGPLISGLLFGFMADKQREAGDIPIPIVGQERAPELVHWLEARGAELVDGPADPRAAVREGEVPFVVAIPEDYAERLASVHPAKLELIVDGSRNDSRAAVAHVKHQLQAYGSDIASRRLLARGIDPEVVSPVVVKEVEVASDEELAASLFVFVPMFVLMATFVGGMQLAVDTTASERERGSLEPLLLNPVPRGAIVGGKWLAAVVFSLVCVALTLVCCVLVLELSPVKDLGMRLDLRPVSLLGIMLAVAPMALMVTALQILVASFARSFKEAQTYISLLIFLPMMPAIVSMMTGFEQGLVSLAIPGIGQQIVVEQLFGGAGVSAIELLVPMSSALVVAGLCVATTTWLFRRESMIV